MYTVVSFQMIVDQQIFLVTNLAKVNEIEEKKDKRGKIPIKRSNAGSFQEMRALTLTEKSISLGLIDQ